jgi:hypothetical protein
MSATSSCGRAIKGMVQFARRLRGWLREGADTLSLENYIQFIGRFDAESGYK